MNEAIDPTTLAYYARSRQQEKPRYLGRRYSEDGLFQSERGNTIVCHPVAGSATEAALLAARQRFLNMSDAHKFAFTAPESLHMTLFEGVLDGNRALPFWPHDVAIDTPLERMTEIFQARLAGFEPGPHFAVEVTGAAPIGLRLQGATAEDRYAMADWRNRLSELLGLRQPNHDHYEFHSTFAYPIAWLDDQALPDWQAMLDAVVTDLRAAAPVLELRAPALCVFEDMNWFEEVLVLEPRA